ncbi:hypothetical protein K1T71_006938 [Dendrolimus kikuchii]|uniref:Uncharacterized protein n=1 Tax=Dendrolimus kikuchii TaxID=765133 RepID=A0ACC1CZ03_9NEOP|nr:hypothetical protein K1T71_006938 [Dendrolimus kikuchii]
MNLKLVLILTYCFFGAFSWSLDDIFEEKFEKINTAFENGKNKFTGWIDSVQDYVENQENKLADSLEKYIDSIEEKQRMIEEKFNSYVETVKETGRKATEPLTIFDESDKIINPDVSLTAPQIIERNGYVCETHTVISQGYVLNIHRIPKSKNGSETSEKTVLLQHGLLETSVDWILNGPGKGLAYVLADAGYDVWMSNIRGNRYSREHKNFSTDSKEYWNFSWHDVALNDMPEIIDYIMQLKGSNTKIVYMGHSMGTTILFAMLTLRPEYNNILKAGYALAPVAFCKDVKTPIKSLSSMAGGLAYIDSISGSYEFVPKNSALGSLTSACNVDVLDTYVCRNVIFYICGYNEKQFNKTLLPVFLSHLGTGTPWKTIVHFSQLVTSGKFQQFDYDSADNMIHYGSLYPPEYDLSKITLPISLFWSRNDLLSSEEDVMLLRSKLRTKTRSYMVPDQKFNHIDYIWAIDVKELLNDEILEYLHIEFGH